MVRLFVWHHVLLLCLTAVVNNFFTLLINKNSLRISYEERASKRNVKHNYLFQNFFQDIESYVQMLVRNKNDSFPDTYCNAKCNMILPVQLNIPELSLPSGFTRANM